MCVRATTRISAVDYRRMLIVSFITPEIGVLPALVISKAPL